MELFEAIKNRRSIRQYKSDPLDDKTVNKVLEAAHWAPSWGNSQCWRFIVVRDPKIKADIAGTLTRVQVDTEWVENAASQSIKYAPVLIVLCAEKGKAGCQPDGAPATDKGEYWYLFDAALAMENLVLAAYDAGLGTVIVGDFNAVKAAKILSVPEGFTVITMTPLGVPENKGQISPRKKLSEVYYTDKFGK